MHKHVRRAARALKLLLILTWASLTGSQALFEQALSSGGDSHTSSSKGSITLSESSPSPASTQLPGSGEGSSCCCSGKQGKPANKEVEQTPARVFRSAMGDEGGTEAAYRRWANTQAAMVARISGLFHFTSILFLVMRDLHKMGYDGFYNSLAAYSPFFLVYASGTLVLFTRPRYSEVAIASFTFFRFLFVLLGGLDIIKITPASRRGLSTAFIYLFEPFYKSLSEQVRIGWVLPLRCFGTVAYASQHMLLQLPSPWLRSLRINVISFAVSLLMDMRMRRMYQNSKRAASKKIE